MGRSNRLLCISAHSLMLRRHEMSKHRVLTKRECRGWRYRLVRWLLGSGLIVDPENDGCCYADGGHKGVGTTVVAGVDAPPVFQASEHDLDFMALSVEHGVVGDVDFAV